MICDMSGPTLLIKKSSICIVHILRLFCIVMVGVSFISTCQTNPGRTGLVLHLDNRSPVSLHYEPVAGYLDKNTGMRFAKKIRGGFNSGKVQIFKKRALGYAISYQNRQCVVTIYMYDRNFMKIPDGTRSAIVRQEASIVQNQMELNLRKRSDHARILIQYKGLREMIPGHQNKSPQLLETIFSFKRDGKQFYDGFYMTGFKKHFFKIRITSTQAFHKGGPEAINFQDFLQALGLSMNYARNHS